MECGSRQINNAVINEHSSIDINKKGSMNDLVASVYVGIDAKEVQVHPDIAKQNMNNKIPV